MSYYTWFTHFFTGGDTLKNYLGQLLTEPPAQAMTAIFNDKHLTRKPLADIAAVLQGAPLPPSERGRQWTLLLAAMVVSNDRTPSKTIATILVNMMKTRGDAVYLDLQQVPIDVMCEMQDYARTIFTQEMPMPLLHGVLNNSPDFANKVKNIWRLQEAPYPLAMEKTGAGIRFLTKMLESDAAKPQQDGWHAELFAKSVYRFCETRDGPPPVLNELEKLVQCINVRQLDSITNRHEAAYRKDAKDKIVDELRIFGDILVYLGGMGVYVHFGAYFAACAKVKSDNLAINTVRNLRDKHHNYNLVLHSNEAGVRALVLFVTKTNTNEPWPIDVIEAVLKYTFEKKLEGNLDQILQQLFQSSDREALPHLLALKDAIQFALRIKVLLQYARGLPAAAAGPIWPPRELCDFLGCAISAKSWVIQVKTLASAIPSSSHQYNTRGTAAAAPSSPHFVPLANALFAPECAPETYLTELLASREATSEVMRHTALLQPIFVDRLGQTVLQAITNKVPLSSLMWLPAALNALPKQQVGAPASVWTRVFARVQEIGGRLDTFSPNEVKQLCLSLFARHVPELVHQLASFQEAVAEQKARIARLGQLESALKTCGALSDMPLARIVTDNVALAMLRAQRGADFLRGDGEAERIGMHFLVDNASTLFRHRLMLLAKEDDQAAAHTLVKLALSQLIRLLGTSTTTLGDLQALFALRQNRTKEELAQEMDTFTSFPAVDGTATTTTFVTNDVLNAAEGILGWRRDLNTLTSAILLVRDPATKQLPAGFQEHVVALEHWGGTVKDDVPVTDANGLYGELLALLPGLVSDGGGGHRRLFDILGRCGDRLRKTLLERFGGGDDQAEFSRMVEMIRRNAGNNADEIELMNSLPSARDALWLMQSPGGVDFASWFASTVRFLSSTPNVLDRVDRCVEQAELVDKLAARLTGGGSLSSQLMAVIMRDGGDNMCDAVFANGEPMPLEEALSQLGENTSDVALVLAKCRDIRKRVVEGRDIGCTAIPGTFMLYRAPGYFDDSIPDGEAVFAPNADVSVLVDDDDGEEEEEALVMARAAVPQRQQQLQEGRRAVNGGASHVLHRLTDDEVERGGADMTNKAQVEALAQKCFVKDYSASAFDFVFAKSVADGARRGLVDFVHDLEQQLVKRRLNVTSAIAQNLDSVIALWENDVHAVLARQPGILMLSNVQLRWFLQRGGIQARSRGVVAKLAGIFDRTGNASIKDLAGIAKMFEKGATKAASGAALDGVARLDKLRVFNLGLCQSRQEVVALTLCHSATTTTTTTADNATPLSPSQFLWCSAETTVQHVENFVQRALHNQGRGFVIVCPSRLDHAARRALVTSVTKPSLTSTANGGSLALVFDDHEVETALHRALGAEKVPVPSEAATAAAATATLKSMLTATNGKVNVKIVQGRVGDGKSWHVEQQLSKDKRLVRIGVHEAFSANQCSERVMEELTKANASSSSRPGTKTNVAIHLDIVGGQSIVEPNNFFATTLGGGKTAHGATKVLRPLEELEKFLFNFAALGFLLNESTGRIGHVDSFSGVGSVDVYVELPGDAELTNMLATWLPIANALQREIIDVSRSIHRAYVAHDADDRFGGWILSQTAAAAAAAASGNKYDFNVGGLYQAFRSWEAGGDDFPVVPTAQFAACVERAMPGWTRRRQRSALRALCDRFARLARFGCFHALKPFRQSSDGSLAEVDLATVNLSTIQLAFMIDATGSMDAYLDQAKARAVSTMQAVKRKHPHAELTFACVLYRDYNAGGLRIEQCAFTSAEGVQSWLVDKQVGYGDDCEDVAGGLDTVAKLGWSAAARSLVWIGDMPAHTPRYSGPMVDSLPTGYAPGMQHTYVDPQVSIRALWEKCVRVFFFKIRDSTDHMIRVLKADYEQPGVDLALEQFHIGTNADLFSQHTLQSIDDSLADVTRVNRQLNRYGNLSITGILRNFSEQEVEEDETETQTLLVVGGDEVQGCSATLVSRSRLAASLNDDDDDDEEDRLYLDEASDAEIRNVVAVALGLSAKSSEVEEILRRVDFAMTSSVAFRTLQQVEMHASHLCFILSGGTGVGKSEGARLQTELALEQGGFDLAFELRSRVLHVFQREPDVAGFTQAHASSFKGANLDLGPSSEWKPSRAKPVIRCADGDEQYESAVFLWPTTLLGRNAPFLLERDALTKFRCELTGDAAGAKFLVAHNGVDSFVIKVHCRTPGTFSLDVKFDGRPVPGSPFQIQTEREDDLVVEDDPIEYLANRVPTAQQCCTALNNAAKQIGDERAREEAQSQYARYVHALLLGWIPEHALVPRTPQRRSAGKLLAELEANIERNPKDSLHELGAFADALRLPKLMFKVCLHPSTEVSALETVAGRAVSRLAKVLQWAESHQFAWAKNLSCTIFLDELNTSSFPGLVKQLVLDRHINGKSLVELGNEYAAKAHEGGEDLSEDRFATELGLPPQLFVQRAADLVLFLGAINPNLPPSSTTTAEGDAVYTVTPLPEALNQVTRRAGELNERMIGELAQSMLRQSAKWLSVGEVKSTTELIMFAHSLLDQYRQEHSELSKVWASIRNVVRVVRLLVFFVHRPEVLFRLRERSQSLSKESATRYAKSSCDNGVELRRRAILLALGTAYWFGLHKMRAGVDLREDFATKLRCLPIVQQWIESPAPSTVPKAIADHILFKTFMLRQIDCVVLDRLAGLCSVEHALTQPLREHFFVIAVCTQAKIPLLIVGPPGCSKSLAANLVFGGFKSERSVDDMFPALGLYVLDEFSMQCSELSTAKEISTVFAQASKTQRGPTSRTLSAVFLDEASLAPRALKALHEPLDQGTLACVMNSNLVLDAAKTNRCLLMRRDEFGDDSGDLLSLAKSSAGLEQGVDNAFLEGCVAGYQLLVSDKSAVQSTFHLRHFLYFVRCLRRQVGGFTQDASEVATALARNFGGLKESLFHQHVGKPFFAEIQRKLSQFPAFPPPGWRYDVAELVGASIAWLPYEHSGGSFNPSLHCPRNLLLVNHGEGLSLLMKDPTQFRAVNVSMFPGDDDALGRDKVISRVIHAMGKGETIVLHGGDKRVYSAFYDAFNMRFSKLQDQYFVSVAVGTVWKSVKYDPKFKCIVVVDAAMYDEMRAPHSNMLPFLSRFEAVCVAPEELLASHLVLQELLGVPQVDEDSAANISAATLHVAKFIESGHGCFMGVDASQSWDVASSLVLRSLSDQKQSRGGGSIGQVDRAAAQSIANKCVETLVHTAKPEALALRSKGEWIPKALLRRYVEATADDHFCLLRLLRHASRSTTSSGSSSNSKRLVIVRSVGMLSSLDELAQATGLSPSQFALVERFETAEAFEKHLDDMTKTTTGTGSNGVVILLANLSFVGSDQLQHALRLVEAKPDRCRNVVFVAHRASEELALDPMSIAKFARGWRTLFVDDVMGCGDLNSAPTRSLLCALRAEDTGSSSSSSNPAGDRRFALAKEVLALCASRVKLVTAPGVVAASMPGGGGRDNGDLANVFYRNGMTLDQVLAECHELLEFVCDVVDGMLAGEFSEKEQICRATDRVSRDKLSGSDAIPFELAAKRATATFRDDAMLSVLYELCFEGNLHSVIRYLTKAKEEDTAASKKEYLSMALKTMIRVETRQQVHIHPPRSAGLMAATLPFFNHGVFQMTVAAAASSPVLAAIATSQALTKDFLLDCLRIVHRVPVDSPVPLDLAYKWMQLTMTSATSGVGEEESAATTKLEDLLRLSGGAGGDSDPQQQHKLTLEVQEITWQCRFLSHICTVEEVQAFLAVKTAEDDGQAAMSLSEFIARAVECGVRRIATNVRGRQHVTSTLVAVRDLLSLSREDSMLELLRESCHETPELLFAFAYHAGFSSARDAAIRAEEHFVMPPASGAHDDSDEALLHACLAMWPRSVPARAAVVSAFMRFSKLDFAREGVLARALAKAECDIAHTSLLLHQALIASSSSASPLGSHDAVFAMLLEHEPDDFPVEEGAAALNLKQAVGWAYYHHLAGNSSSSSSSTPAVSFCDQFAKYAVKRGKPFQRVERVHLVDMLAAKLNRDTLRNFLAHSCDKCDRNDGRLMSACSKLVQGGGNQKLMLRFIGQLNKASLDGLVKLPDSELDAFGLSRQVLTRPRQGVEAAVASDLHHLPSFAEEESATVAPLQRSLDSLVLFQQLAPAVYDVYRALVATSTGEEEEANGDRVRLARDRVSEPNARLALAEDGGAYETIRLALVRDGAGDVLMLPPAQALTVHEAVGSEGQDGVVDCGCLVRAIVALGKRSGQAAELATLRRDEFWDPKGIACVRPDDYGGGTSMLTAMHAFTRRQVGDALKHEYEVQAKLVSSLLLQLADDDSAASVLELHLERVWQDLLGGIPVQWREHDFVLAKSRPAAAASRQPQQQQHEGDLATAGQVDAGEDDDQEEDDDDVAHLERFSNLDRTAQELARLIGHPCVPPSSVLAAGGVMVRFSHMPPLASERHQEKQRLLTVPRGGYSVLACSEAPKLLYQLTYVAEDDYLAAVPSSSLLASCWACVDVLLERNSRFARLDVVLQSKPVPKIKRMRKQLMEIGVRQPQRVIKSVKDLVQFLLREDVVLRLAEDATRPIAEFVTPVDGLARAAELLRLPEDLTGASLSEFLFLLLDVKSRLGLRLFCRQPAFPLVVEDPSIAYGAATSDGGGGVGVINPFLHPPGSFQRRMAGTVTEEEEDEEATRLMMGGEQEEDEDDDGGVGRQRTAAAASLLEPKWGAWMMNRFKPLIGQQQQLELDEEEAGDDAEDGGSGLSVSKSNQVVLGANGWRLHQQRIVAGALLSLFLALLVRVVLSSV